MARDGARVTRRRRFLLALASASAAVPALAVAAFLVLDRLLPPDLSRLHAAGQVVVDRDGRTLAALPAPGGVWRLPVNASDVPPHMLDLLVAAEDRRFRWHPGVDPYALARAAVHWARAGRVVSGGSTLSMQAARLLEPRPRTLRSKAIEAFRALQLEWRHGKEGVLRIWLTLAPMGGNLEGVRAGSLAWFGRPVERLGVAEAALLVAIPRRPEALRPDRHATAAMTARDKLLRLRGAAALPAVEREAALAEGVPGARQPMPNLAPHLSRQVARASEAHAPDAGVVRTSLDAGLQRGAEGLAREVLAGLPGRASVALVVADLRTREVRALVGGEWMAEGRAGALDLTRAVRSPGSALKPLLYAMAFERGLVTPGTVLEDMPRRFGDYAPENYARGFSGRVTAASALRQSLNLPAVALMEGVGPLRFSSAMKALGATPRLPPGAGAALPLALGGAGVTLRELTGLTAALGDGGRAGPLRVSAGGGTGGGTTGEAVVSPGAAAAVAAILTQSFPGGGPEGVAWKTGTSWGGRDAWAVGFDARHVVGVWVGRPDGTPVPGLTGRSHAIPVLSRAFSLLPAAPRARPDAVRAEAGGGARGADGLRLLFPPANAVVDEGAMTFRAAGGQRPLTFLVDGVPVSGEAARRDVAWQPPGPGFYRVTVLDAEGRAATAPIRVRGPE